MRYQGKFATMPVTVLNPKPGFAWKPLPQNNYIDQYDRRQAAAAEDSAVAGGGRRRVPAARVARPDRAVARRRKRCARFWPIPRRRRSSAAEMIDKLIASPAYRRPLDAEVGRPAAERTASIWARRARTSFDEWIRESIAANKPYDRMVREMLTARGSSYDNPAANFFRVTRDPKPTMEKTTQVFLGVRMVCAQCHDHPFERWTQNQYYEMSAFFSAVGLRPGYEVGEEIVYDQRAGLRHEASEGRPRDEAEVHRAGSLRGPSPIPDRSSAGAMRWRSG